MSAIEDSLRDYVRREETAADQGDRIVDSLWDHLLRTAAITEQLGRSEGLDPSTCRLAALFHDAGKFHKGQRHRDSEPEEKRSVEVLGRFAQSHGIPESRVAEISEAILQLYRCDPEPTPLATTWTSSAFWESPTSSSSVASGARPSRPNSWSNSRSS
jgi:hypothetical protein